MPRQGAVSYDTMFNVLKDLPIFTEDGDMRKRQDPIWNEAVRLLPPLNLHNLYIFLHQDRKNLRSNLLKYLNITPKNPIKLKKTIKPEKPSRYADTWDDPDFYETLDTEGETDLTDTGALISMLSNDEYKSIIHRLGIKPFCLYYWDPQQITLWNDLINMESTLSLCVLDNVVAPIKDDFETHDIFVYTLIVKVETCIILLGQMLSDSTNPLEIQHFLTTWLGCNASTPSELVMAYSHNLLNATSLAFNFCTFDNYNLRCYQYLIKEIQELPSTLLHIDLIGLIKVVDRWACFENVLQPVKDFYLCSIMYLSSIDTLEEFKEAVVSILTLCQSPYQSEITETRRASLWANLTTESIQEMNRKYLEYVTGKHGQRSFGFLDKAYTPIQNIPQEINDFINELKFEAFELCDFEVDVNVEKRSNDYYCPIVLEDFLLLLTEFVSWTRVIVKKPECSTLVSLCSSKHLNILSNLTKNPMNAPRFLVYHVEKLNKLIHLGKHSIHVAKCKSKFVVKERKNDLSHVIQTLNSSHPPIDNRIEISVPQEELEENDLMMQDNDAYEVEEVNNVDKNAEIDLGGFKNILQSTVFTLSEFDDSLQGILKSELRPGQDMQICKLVLDCCSEMKSYEKFYGIIAQRFCSASNIFVQAFKQILLDCYSTIDLLDKNEVKNTSKLCAHLLITDSVPWDILASVRLNERDITNAKKNFIRILLKELSEYLGPTRLQKKFEEKFYLYRAMFPTENAKDKAFANAFYRSIGLKELANLLKSNRKKAEEPAPLVRSKSNSSISSASGDEFLIELRVAKNWKSRGTGEVKKKVIVLK